MLMYIRRRAQLLQRWVRTDRTAHVSCSQSNDKYVVPCPVYASMRVHVRGKTIHLADRALQYRGNR